MMVASQISVFLSLSRIYTARWKKILFVTSCMCQAKDICSVVRRKIKERSFIKIAVVLARITHVSGLRC